MGLILSLSACSSGKLSISSAGTKTKILAIGSDSAIHELGMTPLDIDQSKIFTSKNNYVELLAQNEDGQVQRILITRPFLQTDIAISFDFKASSISPELLKARENLEKVSLAIAKSYKLISQKNLIDAQVVLNDLKNEFPGVSVTYDFLGNIEYLKGNYAQALSHYERANVINSNNVERELMIKRLKQKSIGNSL